MNKDDALFAIMCDKDVYCPDCDRWFYSEYELLLHSRTDPDHEVFETEDEYSPRDAECAQDELPL